MLDEYAGDVITTPFALGSKSEHEAVMLHTPKGEFALRRVEGNPFRDLELEKLVGKHIVCHGELIGYTLTITDWKVIGGDGK